MTSKYGMMKVICMAMTCLFLAGCAKLPERLISPILKIEPTVSNGATEYTLTLSTGIQNENNDIVFLDMKGNIFFMGEKKSGVRVFSIPFELPALLPFDTGIIEVEKTYTENEIMPLLSFLGTDKERLAKDKVLERSFTDGETIGFELTGYEKKNILDVLKEKIDEKNK